MEHVMVDIETFGTSSNSVITSISLVEFDINTGKTNREVEYHIDINSSLEAGLHIDGGTVLWWLSQPKEAQELLVGGQHVAGFQLIEVLNYVADFLNTTQYIWGNSPRLDLGLMADSYKKLNMDIPWDFRKERDVRTLVAFAPEIKENMEFVGTPHYGIDDCHHQIKYCCETWKKLNK